MLYAYPMNEKHPRASEPLGLCPHCDRLFRQGDKACSHFLKYRRDPNATVGIDENGVFYWK
jgi:hypothetical protein